MRELLNTLYVTTQGATLRLDHGTVRVIVEDKTVARLPLVRLQAIVVFGRVTITTPLIHRCAEDGRGVAWLTRHGRFRARLTGRTLGNVLLRRAQHEALDDPERTLALARQYVAGKVQNARTLTLRSARDSAGADDEAELRAVADNLASLLGEVRDASDLDVLRGLEGIAARAYFRGFGGMVRADRAAFTPDGRTRRPPRDRANALLSFCYALLRAECEFHEAALIECEGRSAGRARPAGIETFSVLLRLPSPARVAPGARARRGLKPRRAVESPPERRTREAGSHQRN